MTKKRKKSTVKNLTKRVKTLRMRGKLTKTMSQTRRFLL